jgi:hypothetical protein
MRKNISALILAAGLLAAPLPASSCGAVTQAVRPALTITLAAKQKSNKPPTPAQLAFRARQKKCGAEWKAAKAAGKIEKGMKWPQFWSACNKRLKNGG